MRSKRGLTNDEGESLYGLADFSSRTIWLAYGMKPNVKLNTFFHELFHVIEEELHIRQTLPAGISEVWADGFAQFAEQNWSVTWKRKRRG